MAHLCGPKNGHKAKRVPRNTQIHSKQLAGLAIPPRPVHSAYNEDTLWGGLAIVETCAFSIVVSRHKRHNSAGLLLRDIDLHDIAAKSSE